MSSFAKNGNRVLFIENTGIRNINLSDVPRLKRRFLNWWKSARGFRQEQSNLYVYSPLALPFPYSRIIRYINRFIMIRDLRRWAKIMRFDSPIVWTFLPTPLVVDTIENLNPKLVIYYCIDNFAASSSAARKIHRSETKMLKNVDLVFVTSQQLYDCAAQYSKDVYLFPFAVNMEAFDHVRERKNVLEPNDLAHIPHPRIGYVGGIHRWMDMDLLYQLAGLCPDFQFVLVGPVQISAEQIKSLSNIHWLGAKPHQDLPLYIKAFDVGLIPYRLTEYTDNVYPTKLNEYLAMGKPIVSTPLREVKIFNEQHEHLISVASDAEGFKNAIQDILFQKEHQETKRIAIARENSWSARIEKMSHLISQKLPERVSSMENSWQKTFLDLYRNGRRKIAVLSMASVAFFGLLFCSPLLWMIAAPLKISNVPHKVDAIVVFAGGVGESGKAGEGHEERVRKAINLYKAGYAKDLIFSSGYQRVFNEPEVMKAIAVANEVPAPSIFLEKEAGNTYENVVNVLKIIQQNHWHSILLVSSPYHMRRASLVFEKQSPELKVSYTPAEYSNFYRHTFGANLEQITGIFQEYTAIAYYRFKGWL